MCLSNNQDPAVAQFAQFQLDLGSGKNLPADGNVNMPRDLYLHGATILPLIQHIYPTIQSNPHPAPAYFIIACSLPQGMRMYMSSTIKLLTCSRHHQLKQESINLLIQPSSGTVNQIRFLWSS